MCFETLSFFVASRTPCTHAPARSFAPLLPTCLFVCLFVCVCVFVLLHLFGLLFVLFWSVLVWFALLPPLFLLLSFSKLEMLVLRSLNATPRQEDGDKRRSGKPIIAPRPHKRFGRCDPLSLSVRGHPWTTFHHIYIVLHRTPRPEVLG